MCQSASGLLLNVSPTVRVHCYPSRFVQTKIDQHASTCPVQIGHLYDVMSCVSPVETGRHPVNRQPLTKSSEMDHSGNVAAVDVGPAYCQIGEICGIICTPEHETQSEVYINGYCISKARDN